MNIIELSDGTLINLREVAMVGPVGGDQSWLSYRVYFRGFNEPQSIYESRRDMPNYPREKFVAAWKKVVDTTANL